MSKRKMSVATELRACWPNWHIGLTHMTDEAWHVVCDAKISLLGLGRSAADWNTYWADILSEAIEAADALGL